MRTTEMVLLAPFLKTSKFIPACISIYILSLPSADQELIRMGQNSQTNSIFFRRGTSLTQFSKKGHVPAIFQGEIPPPYELPLIIFNG